MGNGTAAVAAQQRNEQEFGTTPRPDRPVYGNLAEVDPTTGLLGSQYQIHVNPLTGELDNRLDKIQLDKRGLEAFRERALGKGPSTWGNMMLQQQKLQEEAQRDAAAQQAAGAQAQARSALAMRGGMTGGARERLAQTGARDQLMASQGVMRQGAQDRAGILTKDEEMRMQTLSQLPGMEVAALQPELQKANAWANMAQFDEGNRLKTDQFNIDKALQEVKNKRDWDMGIYHEDMAAWAADQQAKATAEADNGGCFITTAVCGSFGLPDDCYELNTLRRFRDQYLAKAKGGKKQIQEYYDTAPKIVSAINAQENKASIYRRIHEKWLAPAIRAIEQGQNDIAHRIYKNMVLNLKSTYLKETN